MEELAFDRTLTGWADSLRNELARNQFNGKVGSRLVSESEGVRVWHLTLAPGERMGFHRHVLDYFWTAITPGHGRSHYGDGRVLDTTYAAGDTRHHRFAKDEFMIHDLENIGETILTFVTVEFLKSANQPLDLSSRDER